MSAVSERGSHIPAGLRECLTLDLNPSFLSCSHLVFGSQRGPLKISQPKAVPLFLGLGEGSLFMCQAELIPKASHLLGATGCPLRIDVAFGQKSRVGLVVARTGSLPVTLPVPPMNLRPWGGGMYFFFFFFKFGLV